MIHRIATENFGSIRERQVIDLALPATTPRLDRFAPSKGDPTVRLPTVVAFFGPNASGKTTVLRAFTSTIDFALNSFALPPDSAIPYFQPFRSSDWSTRPTRITVDFDAVWLAETARVYRYDVTIDHRDRAGERVMAESLLVRDGRRFRALFKRDGQKTRCAAELRLPVSDGRLKAVRPNASLISTMAQLNHEFFRKIWADIGAILRNVHGFSLSRLDVQVAIEYLNENQEALAALKHQLRRLDLGLSDLDIVSTDRGPVVKFTHEGLDDAIFLHEESNGTRQFLSLYPVLWFTLQTGRPAVLDEFDVDLHPLLIPELLLWFQEPAINFNQAQLFVAAHNIAIMDFLEKEEIYLVDKRRDGASELTALRDVKGLRREPSLQRKYLSGVFGALPNIG